jgi:AcrR family transcriptional regulator
MSQQRDALLARIVDDVGRNGLHDRSLRELATATGTSHRMLIYHFGSREGLVAAIVGAVEQAQRELMRELAADAESPAALVRALWARVSAPDLQPFIRLFFEAASYAPATQERTTPWLEDAEAVAPRLGVSYDPVEVRLGVAVIRGLLLDILSGAAVEDATASLERFLAMWEAHRAPSHVAGTRH